MKKSDLKNLKVKSFVTSEDKSEMLTIKGGSGNPLCDLPTAQLPYCDNDTAPYLCNYQTEGFNCDTQPDQCFITLP